MPESITHTGDKQAAESIHRVGERGSDLRRAGSTVRTAYREAQIKRFRSDGFGRWPAIKASTLETDRRQGRNTRPMVQTGALYRSLTAARASGQVDERTRSELTFGTTVPYATYHEDGRGVPKRDLVAFPFSDQKKLTEALARYIAAGKP